MNLPGRLVAFICGGAGFMAVATEPDFDAVHRTRVESLRHDSLTLNITLPKSSFFLGELIPVTFQFEDTKNVGKYETWTGTYDRSGRIQDLNFFIGGPAGSYCDPLAGYFSGFGLLGGIGNYAKLGRYEQVFHLNEWIRFDRPGKYRVYATSTRTSWTSDNFIHPVELMSPVVTIEIRTATTNELADTYREAAAVLAAATPQTSSGPAFYEALSRLRYLDTDASRRHLRGLFGAEHGVDTWAEFGLIGTRDTDAAIALLEGGIADPEVAVTSSYGYALTKLRENRERSKLQAQQPKQTPSEAKSDAAPAPGRFDYFGDRADWKKVVDAFDRKTGRARAVCALSLFEVIKLDRQQERGEAEADAKGIAYVKRHQERLNFDVVMAKLRVPLAEAFLDLTENEQSSLLEHSWELIRGPELLPALRKIVSAPMAQPDQSFSSSLRSLAVMRFAELDPVAGKPLILEDLRRMHPKYSLQALCSLPREELKKELPLLASHFATREPVDQDKVSGIISHIANDSVFEVVEQRYLEKEGDWEWITQTHCLSYFIKVRRAEGLDLAFSALLLRGKPHTSCYSSVASKVLGPHYGPDVELRMLEVLGHEPEPEVISDMVGVLLEHGTQAVIDSLLDVIERLSPKAINEDYSYRSEAGVRHFVVEGLIREASEGYVKARRWKLTPAQKARLKSSLASEQEKKGFENAFKAD